MLAEGEELNQTTGPAPGTTTAATPHSPFAASPSSVILPSIDDTALLIDSAAGILTCEQIAAKHNMALKLYLDWYSSPQTATRLAAMETSRTVNRQRKYESWQDEAAESLRDLHIKSGLNNDPVERRRSATALLRFTTSVSSSRSSPARLFAAMGTGINTHRRNADYFGAGDSRSGLSLSRFPGHYRTRSRTVRTAPVLHEAPAILPPPFRPIIAADPAATTCMLMSRLQDPDNPAPGDALRTLFNHFTPAWKKATGAGTADDFARTDIEVYHCFLAHTAAVLHPTEFEPPSEYAPPGSPSLRAVQPLELVSIDGELITAEFAFTRTSGSHPWLINHIRIRTTPDESEDSDEPYEPDSSVEPDPPDPDSPDPPTPDQS